ncbi:MAG: hypothetical protein IKH30_00755 [Clostridia bacterium]|nr:hypothetical protein [Clostridia bacterium]
MDQITNELKKMVKAGMGAVAAGMEKTQEAIDTFAKKGEPIYQQAKSAVSDAADKVKQAVNEGIQSMNCKPKAEEIIGKVKDLTQEEWEQIRGAVDDFFAKAKEAAEKAKEEAEAAPDGAADAEAAEASAEEKEADDPAETVDPMDIAESMQTGDTSDDHPEE